MYLLKQGAFDRTGDLLLFTFHHVSIKTGTAAAVGPAILILFTFHHVSIKTK